MRQPELGRSQSRHRDLPAALRHPVRGEERGAEGPSNACATSAVGSAEPRTRSGVGPTGRASAAAGSSSICSIVAATWVGAEPAGRHHAQCRLRLPSRQQRVEAAHPRERIDRIRVDQVVHRREVAPRVGGPEPKLGDRGVGVRAHVGVREHHTLREAGGATRVVHLVAFRCLEQRRREKPRASAAPASSAAENRASRAGGGAGSAGGAPHATHTRAGGGRRMSGIAWRSGGAIPILSDHKLGLGIVDDVRELGRREARVQVEEDDAQRRRRSRRRRPPSGSPRAGRADRRVAFPLAAATPPARRRALILRRTSAGCRPPA